MPWAYRTPLTNGAISRSSYLSRLISINIYERVQLSIQRCDPRKKRIYSLCG
nr:hypothetical protein SHINE37_90059 [Rhizobiaceae bacterium]